MNKTLSIALAGFSFVIEEHAYIKLSDYLKALRGSLEAEEAEEVMHDIEIRMVEILKESLGKREVVNDADIEKIIAQIGSPEKIEEQEEAYYSDKQSKDSQKSRKTYGNFSGQKQLFRDPENQKIGGVCSGLAAYTGLEITVMRLIWVGAFLLMMPLPGSPLLIVFLYIILWMVLPKAQTASDFLKMKGKPANFDNLKEESSKIIQFANESTEKVGQVFHQSKPYITKAGSGLGDFLRICAGLLFALLALSLLIGSFAVFGSFQDGDTSWDISNNLSFYLKENNLSYLLLGLGFLSVFIPAVLFSFIAIRLLSPKTKLNYTGYVIGGLVLAWIGFAAVFGVMASRLKMEYDYNGTKEETENISINTTSDSILIDVKKVNIGENFKSYWKNIYSDEKTIFKKDYPDVDITRKEVKQPYLIIKKEADGYNQSLQMNVPVEVQGNKILLPNYFSYPYKNRFRDYNVAYELVVPKHMKIVEISNDVDINDDYNSSSSSQKSIDDEDNDTDSIIVNGKKVAVKDIKVDEKPTESGKLKIKKDSIKEINLNIKNGNKPEISIKTK
ncbi:MAG: PspC domain-containing protein [Cloacibacterium sp.]|nr:PspC domain-containing protein [Cloacibacterium sp.]